LSKKKLYIFPFGGNALEALDCLNNDFKFAGFIDDDPSKHNTYWNNFKIHPRDIINEDKDAYFLAVQGSPDTFKQRQNLIQSLCIDKNRYSNIIHPNSSISNYANIGYNCLIMSGVIINSTSKIGNHVLILPNTVIHHHAEIEDYTIVGSQVVVAGHSKIRKNCYIGSGSKIINNIEIGKNTLIGLGSVVINNIGENKKVAGNPAKQL
jgi:UDP-perosamine 4-acetyltransferase